MSAELALERARPRVLAILVASFMGFLAGQLIATLLETVGAALAHFPGGLNALATLNAPPWWANALGLLGLWIGFAGAIAYAYGPGGLSNWAEQWRLRRGDVLYLALGPLLQLGIDLAYSPFHLRHLDRPAHHLFDGASGALFVLIAVMTVLLAPLFEEWFFRGVIVRALSEGLETSSRRSAQAIAVVLSAVLFGAAHAEAAQFAGLFALGVVLALLVLRTKRLTPSILTHVSFNATALVAVIVQRAHS